MGSSPPKSTSLRNLFTRILSFALLLIVLRVAYIITITDTPLLHLSTGIADRSSSLTRSSSQSQYRLDLQASKEWRRAVDFYSSTFQDLIFKGLLSLSSKSLCVETPRGEDVFGLREIGVNDSVGIFNKAFPPLVRFGRAVRQPFGNSTFDFVFSGDGRIDGAVRPFEFALEIGRVLKDNGAAVVHTRSARDVYSFNSFIDLFSCCSFVSSREIDRLGFRVTEIVFRKNVQMTDNVKVNSNANVNKCVEATYRKELVGSAEPLIMEEPLKPWITLKRNLKNINYLPSILDISFKRKYVYVDVGARSYSSSIGSWFRKQYPKQNKSFEIYAIEADKAFHEEYKTKKNVKLLPYAAWLRNETLFFEINRDPVQKDGPKRRGMGRIQTVQSSFSFMGDLDKIRGFDFAHWLKNTVSEKDFVVMKMDVEGTEFDLIPKLFETGVICFIDEIFLECHYNRWQKCCPGKRSPKYQKTYAQCLELFTSLRENGILVHQWW